MSFRQKGVAGLLIIGAAAVAIGSYSIFKKPQPQVIIKEIPVKAETSPTQFPNAQTAQTAKPSYYPSQRGLATVAPSVSISADGRICTIVVPADAPNGVKAEDSTGKQFTLTRGQRFEVEANGEVEYASNHPIVGPQGETGGYYDYSVDSPFHHNVGGLEFSIGPLGANRYFAGRYYLGTAKYTGVPIFRIVESVNGYLDGNYGAFTVTVRKLAER
jgi:hypothetical protein